MIVFLFVIAIASLPGIKYRNTNSLQPIFTKEMSLALRGIFTVVILISHTEYSYDLVLLLNEFPRACYFYDQFTVVPFFLLSGYAAAHSIINKKGYMNRFIKNNIISLYLKFFFSNLLFIFLSISFSEKLPLSQYLLSFIGLKKPLISRLGNCNWFVVIILAAYVFTFISYRIFYRNIKATACMLSVFCFITVCILAFSDAKEYYWNTLLIYPLGFIIKICERKILKLFNKKQVIYALSAVTSILFTAIFHLQYRKNGNHLFFIIAGIFFAAAISLISIKIKTGNKFLYFIGSHSFEIYILQGIPMKLLESAENTLNYSFLQRFPSADFLFYNGTKLNPYIYTVLVFIMTVALSALFKLIFDKCFHRTKNGAMIKWQTEKTVSLQPTDLK